MEFSFIVFGSGLRVLDTHLEAIFVDVGSCLGHGRGGCGGRRRVSFRETCARRAEWLEDIADRLRCE